MFTFNSPITYNTDVGTLAFNYFAGITQGYQPYYENPWNGFNINSLYTLGNGFFQLYQNYGYTGWNIFKTSNWCNWQGINTTNQTYYNNYNNFPNIFKWGENMYSERSYVSTPIKTSQVQKSDKPVKKVAEKTTAPPPSAETLGTKFLNNANKYMGLNEADGSWQKISKHPEWCADFIYHVIDETYTQQGKTVPKGLKKELPEGRVNHRVEELKQWGIDNNKFFQTANKANKGKLIAENVKPGDILILREDGASHTGFVTKVNKDGTFETIEGNRNDKVCKAKYSPNYHEISGFVQLT